jgi:hypothetical protein
VGTQICYLSIVPDIPAAKKEDSPEDALKAFRAIVEKEETKGDWYVHVAIHATRVHLTGLFPSSEGASRL